jgi:hypothetical protein
MKPNVGRALLPALVLAGFVLSGCGLPRPLRDEIAAEKEKLRGAQQQYQTARDQAAKIKGANPWSSRLAEAKSKLDRAGRDQSELQSVEHESGKEAVRRAGSLLSDERQLRGAALSEITEVRAAATRWLEFERDPQNGLNALQRDYQAVSAVDLAPVTAAVARAEKDWPAKKSDLDGRLSSLRNTAQAAEQDWNAAADARQAAAAGKPADTQITALVQADEKFSAEAAGLKRDSEQLRGMTDQLYDAWDKVLDDLETAHRGDDRVYREKIKTVRTHFIDVPAKQTRTESDEKWVDVSAAQYRSVENDLGMAIAHKDAGLYDSEARTVAQPPGFAYVAPPEVGSNQYGYWTHTDHGSVWTFLPQYLIMRELFWGHSYRPIVINEYNGYSQALRSGRPYYGQETPAAPPKYGTHGTFTEKRYAGSRYVQSGGFKGSAYGSHGSSAQGNSSGSPGPRPGSASEGKRFGSGSASRSSPPSGRRFGSGGSRPRSFGRRR